MTKPSSKTDSRDRGRFSANRKTDAVLRLGYEGFIPATAHAGLEMIHRSGVEIRGADAVVVGRSPVVGMPLAFMLTKEDATVTVCHSKTRDLRASARRTPVGPPIF